MSEPRQAVDDMATAEGRHEAAYADDATATGRREAEYQEPASPGERGAHDAEAHTDALDELRPEAAQVHRSMPVEDEPARAPSDGNLPPGQDVHAPIAAFWATDQVEQYRSQWRDLQSTFVEDPKQAMGTAASLIDEAVASLTNTVKAQKQALDGWQVTRSEDTEVMRVALLRYRDFLNRLLGL